MGRRLNDYERLDVLPKNALTVQEYADRLGTTKQNIYNRVRRNKNDNFKIVEFKRINFVILTEPEPTYNT